MLTTKERAVLRLLTRELTYEEIATKLGVTINTVRTHIRVIYRKLQVGTRTAAVLNYPGETHVNITGTGCAVVYDGKGPAEVSLRRNQDYKIKITKPGYQTETVQVTSSNVWWWLFPMLTITGPFELISVFNGSIYAFNEDGIEVTLFRDGQRPKGAVSYDP